MLTEKAKLCTRVPIFKYFSTTCVRNTQGGWLTQSEGTIGTLTETLVYFVYIYQAIIRPLVQLEALLTAIFFVESFIMTLVTICDSRRLTLCG